MSVKYQAKTDRYIHRSVAGTDMLISVGENIARFNGYIDLNASGAVIWEALKTPATVEDVADKLVSTFEIPRETALADAEEFLKELLENDMVTAL